MPKAEKHVQKFEARVFDLTTNTDTIASQFFEELNRENFAWIDQQAAQARKNKEVLKGGFWKIRTIYTGLSSPANNSDEEYKKHFERLNRWKELFPNSITPRVAIAESWMSYAGEARGGGYANTVTEQGWKLYAERLNVAEKEIVEALKIEEHCPYQYVVMLELAREQSRSFEYFDAIYQEAIEFEPTFYYYYRSKAIYLLPRWNGKKGEWEKYLEQAAENLGSPNGEIIYYLVASHFVLNVGDMPFDRMNLSWDKLRRGFYALRQSHGADKQRLNEFAKFSIQANDFSTARKIFAEIGDDWDKKVWHTKVKFEQYRAIPEQFERFEQRQILQNNRPTK